MRRLGGENHQLVPNVTTEQKRAHCDAGLDGSAHVSIPHDDVYVCHDLFSRSVRPFADLPKISCLYSPAPIKLEI